MSALELICDDNNLCGEGPLWDPWRKRLIWNDGSSSLLFDYSPTTKQRQLIHSGLMVSTEAWNADTQLVLAGATGLHLWNGQDPAVTLISCFEGESLCFNDMIAEPTGGVYAGTIYWDANGMQKPGKLFHISADLRVSVILAHTLLANGLCLSPDHTKLYFADSAARKIYVFDLKPGDPIPSRRRVFVTVGADEGIPDGLTVDANGFIWSAQWYGSQVVRYDPDGKIERRVEMPVRQISSVAFGGDELQDLYITTAAEHAPGPLGPPGYDFDAPNRGGGLYRLQTDVKGLPECTARFLTPA